MRLHPINIATSTRGGHAATTAPRSHEHTCPHANERVYTHTHTHTPTQTSARGRSPYPNALSIICVHKPISSYSRTYVRRTALACNREGGDVPCVRFAGGVGMGPGRAQADSNDAATRCDGRRECITHSHSPLAQLAARRRMGCAFGTNSMVCLWSFGMAFIVTLDRTARSHNILTDVDWSGAHAPMAEGWMARVYKAFSVAHGAI